MDFTQTDSSLTSPSQTDSTPDVSRGTEQLPQSLDLEKHQGKFRFDGQEMTYQDLKNAYLRQKDYTRKTQALAEERKTWESERKSFEDDKKYYENLQADLDIVRQNPNLASEFIKVYPQKFHAYLQKIVNTQTQSSSAQQAQGTKSFDVAYESRLANLEKFYHEQEVAKNEAEINATIDRLTAKYPNAVPEMVIGRVFEAYSQVLKNNPNAKLTADMWEDTFKSVDQFMSDRLNTMYKSKQQEQIKANKRSSDVSVGGGTVGRAPQKFNRLKDVTEHAVRDLTGR